MVKKKAGRPSKIDIIDMEQVMKLASLGVKQENIAYVLDIAMSTLSLYKKKYPEFSEALKVGAEISDARVERSLFERSIGYDCPEDKVFCTKNGRIKTVRTIKHYPPDPVSCIFWLKNRDPKKWREKIDISHGLDDPLMEKFKDVNADELISTASKLAQGIAGAVKEAS